MIPSMSGYWLYNTKLLPANEVWGKVIFLHQFVILFTGGACVVAPGGGHMWLLWGDMHGCSRGACVVLFGGACVVTPGGHVWFYLGGMHGCSGGVCMVAWGCVWFYLAGHAWLLQGGVCGFIRGHAWFYSGGHAWFYSGGMRGFIRGHAWFYSGGHAWFYSGGACVVFSVFSDTMRYGQWAGGTHPTGMHSCLQMFSHKKNLFSVTNCR